MTKPPALSPYFGPLLIHFSRTLESFTRATLREFQSVSDWLDAMESDGYQSLAEREARARWLDAYNERELAGRRLMTATSTLVAIVNLNPPPASA